MNVKQMEMVLELSKTLNFNKAAQKLYITQPALSYQIKSLETEVGFRIFERRNGVEMTPAGKLFCARLQQIHSQIQLAVEEGQNYSASMAHNVVPYQRNIYQCV